jgi:hypothetical protein
MSTHNDVPEMATARDLSYRPPQLDTAQYGTLELKPNDDQDQPERQSTYSDWKTATNPLPAHYLDVDIVSDSIKH